MLEFLLAAGRPAAWRRRFGSHVVLLLLVGVGLMPSRARAQSVLAQFPLISSYTSTTAPGITVPANPTFSSLVLTTSGAAIGYSGLGQAFAPNADGTGWTGTPLLTRYEEFSATVASGYNARVDSLYLSTAFNNAASGRLGIAYSTDGFVTSTFIYGSISGTTITGGAVNNVTQLTGSNST